MTGSRPWLTDYSWDFVVAQNALLCQAKQALHKPTSDGYEHQTALGKSHLQSMRFDEAAELCRRFHRLAPFCIYNGNTFAAIIRDVVLSLGLPPQRAYVVRSLAGHIVAGVATAEEERAFREFCASLE